MPITLWFRFLRQKRLSSPFSFPDCLAGRSVFQWSGVISLRIFPFHWSPHGFHHPVPCSVVFHWSYCFCCFPFGRRPPAWRLNLERTSGLSSSWLTEPLVSRLLVQTSTPLLRLPFGWIESVPASTKKLFPFPYVGAAFYRSPGMNKYKTNNLFKSSFFRCLYSRCINLGYQHLLITFLSG
jgi:hypothetical protein